MGYMWDFSKLPKEEYARVIERVEMGDARTLMLIHNEYGLSRDVYCCGAQQQMVMNWFKYGIETGQIRMDGESLPE